jgi:hypothetical protein
MQKPIKLYDAGGWFLIPALLGVGVVGLALDYFWNYLVFILGLRRLHFSLTTKKKHIYCIIATCLGLAIDWLYYRLAWGSLSVAGSRIQIFKNAGEQPVLEVLSILVPMVALMLANYILSRVFLHMNPKQAVALGAIMGFFTAPWLITGKIVFFS